MARNMLETILRSNFCVNVSINITGHSGEFHICKDKSLMRVRELHDCTYVAILKVGEYYCSNQKFAEQAFVKNRALRVKT